MIEWLFGHPKVYLYLAVLGAITLVCLIVFAGCWLWHLLSGQHEEQEIIYFVERDKQ